MEPAVRDLKAGGLAHLPSGDFNANAGWLACAAPAASLYDGSSITPGTPSSVSPWAAPSAGGCSESPDGSSTTAARLLLRLPAGWRWARRFLTALANIRSLPQLC